MASRDAESRPPAGASVSTKMATLPLRARTRAPTSSNRVQSVFAHTLNVRSAFIDGGAAALDAWGRVFGEAGSGAKPHERRSSPRRRKVGNRSALLSSAAGWTGADGAGRIVSPLSRKP